jgi:hypothetical protein
MILAWILIDFQQVPRLESSTLCCFQNHLPVAFITDIFLLLNNKIKDALVMRGPYPTCPTTDKIAESLTTEKFRRGIDLI